MRGSAQEARAGRQRRAQADAAILAAARQLLADVGYDRISIAEVARRAGVAKTTIYRRWPSRRELLAAALDGLNPSLEFPDSGSLRGDLELLVSQADLGIDQLQVMSSLLASTARDDGLLAEYWQRYVAARRAALRQPLERAQQRGELRGDLDLELLVDLAAGAILYQVIRPSDAALSDRLRDAFELLWSSVAS